MKEQEYRQFATGLMAVSEAVFLSTVDGEDRPHIRAMLNLRNKGQYPSLVELFSQHEDDYLVYFTTNTSSPKVGHIKANPAVAAYYCIPSKFHGLMLGGTVEIVEDPQQREAVWQPGWENFYPAGPNDPDHTLLRLLPSKASGWHGEGTFSFNLGG